MGITTTIFDLSLMLNVLIPLSVYAADRLHPDAGILW